MDARGDDRTAGAARPPATGGWPPWFVLAIIAAVQIVGTFGATQGQDIPRGVDALTIALLLAGPLAIGLSRRLVVLGAAVVMVITFVYMARGYAMGPVVISPVVALIRVVLSGHRRTAWVLAGTGVAAATAGHRLAGEHSDAGWVSVLAVVGWVAVVLVVADIARSRLARREASRRARTEQQRRQASEERLRIAQELHDVLAHNISMINVQAGVGLHLMDTHPEQARDALSAIKQASKDTLGELRAVLDLLRGTDTAPRMPTGGLGDLDALVGRVRTADLQVTVRRTGTPRDVPAEVDLAAFRIVQEALTNVVRHAPTATSVVVWLDFRDRSLAVHVDDDGRVPALAADDADGNGLPGMRERATALGGSFRGGPRPGGGFGVHAVLPTGPATDDTPAAAPTSPARPAATASTAVDHGPLPPADDPGSRP